jgi:hypothetical protein
MLNSESYVEQVVNSALSVDYYGAHSLIQRINMLAWCSIDEADGNIRNEAGRVNANLLKLIHKNSIPNLGRLLLKYGCVPLLVQIVTGYIVTIPPPDQMVPSDFLDEKYVDLKPNRTFQTFPVVQNEGIVALVLLCSLCQEALDDIALHHMALVAFFKSTLLRTEAEGSVPIKESSTIDSITTLNASHLLLILCQGNGNY